MLLADNETKIDLLNNEAIATTIVKLLLGVQSRHLVDRVDDEPIWL